MKKILIAAAAGGLIAFVWANMMWMVFPFYTNLVGTFPQEDLVRAALKQTNAESGVYVVPGMVDWGDKVAMALWKEKHEQGPFAYVAYTAQGSVPGMSPQMIRGLLLNILGACLMAVVLTLARIPSFSRRVLCCVVVGVFAAVAGPLMNWNWWRFPTQYTLLLVVDGVVAAALMGLAVAAIVKPGQATG